MHVPVALLRRLGAVCRGPQSVFWLYSGGPRKWYPQLWAEKSLSVCVCVFVTKTAFFGRTFWPRRGGRPLQVPLASATGPPPGGDRSALNWVMFPPVCPALYIQLLISPSCRFFRAHQNTDIQFIATGGYGDLSWGGAALNWVISLSVRSHLLFLVGRVPNVALFDVHFPPSVPKATAPSSHLGMLFFRQNP